MANILHTLLTTIQSDIQNNVTLTSQDNEVPAIDKTNAVVIRKLGLRERDWEIGHRNELKPGILIVYSGQEAPPNGGTNNRQDVYYNIDLIIIVQDNQLREAGIDTYTQWEQVLQRRYNHNSSISWPNNSDGVIWDTWGLGSQSVNDWRWVQNNEAAMGVRVRIVSREPQGQ